MTERKQIVERTRKRLRRDALARIQLTVILIGTATVGFLLSRALLAVGVSSMAVRYPLAVLGAYGCFIAFVRIWVELRRRGLELEADVINLVPDLPEAADALGGGGEFGGGGASDTWGKGHHLAADASAQPPTASSGGSGDGADVFDLDEGWLVLVPIAMLLGALVVSVLVIWSAPVLLAEVLIDVALVSTLYKRLTRVPRRWWVATVIRKTWIPVTIVAVLMLVGGLIMQLSVPDAKSIGDVITSLSAKVVGPTRPETLPSFASGPGLTQS